ncbi:hypothetical protein BDK92_7189 [Micromonospora pisi]|uniref:Uncharacterized protein n=1 Tax=Micromonospora pisi TaxID=589240 RepID=A0A495JV55_9ACTN|nr:hypothetical protein [Micromonospora pisi]RKR92711.1 hypothetical protein BDK92_7189 [Micromonospora pisi]
MARKTTVPTCGDCQATNQPQGRARGLCIVCSPLTVLHLRLAGDQATYCGRSMYIVTNDPDQDSTINDLDHKVNCPDCLWQLRHRRSH